jgi:hypothetical protein
MHVAAPLAAGNSPLAVLEPDGRTLVYSTWVAEGPTDDSAQSGTPGGRPSIRLLDLRTGRDRPLVYGAVSFAVSASGSIAYVRGDRPEYLQDVAYTGTIEEVRPGASGPPVTLVGASRNYRVAAWAGRSLLYYVEGDGESLDLFVVAEGARPRLVARSAEVVAISPDGAAVLVQSDQYGPAGLALYDVATGRELAEVDRLRDEQGRTLSLGMNGDWYGSLIVAEASADLVYLRVDGDRITVERTVDLGIDRLPWGLETPRFSTDGLAVTAFTIDPNAMDAVVIRCPALSDECTLTVPNPSAGVFADPIFNPSRG